MQNAWNVGHYHHVTIKKCCCNKLESVINRSWHTAQHTQTKPNLKTPTILDILIYSHDHCSKCLSTSANTGFRNYGAVLIINKHLLLSLELAVKFPNGL